MAESKGWPETKECLEEAKGKIEVESQNNSFVNRDLKTSSSSDDSRFQATRARGEGIA